MKISKLELENSILVIAESYGLVKNYDCLIESRAVMPSLINMIIYEMFINEFDKNYCSSWEFEAYENILDYAKELNEQGEVKFI